MNWLAFSHGAALCASLIVTIGAQNTFVLRQGIMRAHVGKIALICILSDCILIAAGVSGASVLVERYPMFVHTVLYIGLVYLSWFGFSALHRAFLGDDTILPIGVNSPVTQQTSIEAVVMTLAFTWLNPHVYLDTFLLIGTAGANEAPGMRFAFSIGAISSSITWFISLGYGARILAPWFNHMIAWRVLDGIAGCMMLSIAVRQLL
ncbi:MAG: LysE/ArgO family amino acid transporter [Burkholderia sp.]|nr:LysE/ArgO family amino acid transporter [Burkholderia sp.]